MFLLVSSTETNSYEVNKFNVHQNSKTDLVSLFVEGQPVVFEVQKRQRAFYFEPLTSWKDHVIAKSFSLEHNNSRWTSTSLTDCDLFHQAVEEIERRYNASCEFMP